MNCLRTVHCEPSPAVFLTNTEDVRSSMGTVFICSFPDSHDVKASWGVGRVLWIRKVVFVVGSSLSPGSQEVRGRINFTNMFASVYAALDNTVPVP